MEIVIVSIFILGYLGITLEHTTEIDKLAPALMMMALSWACIAFGIHGFTSWFDAWPPPLNGWHTWHAGFYDNHRARQGAHCGGNPIAPLWKNLRNPHLSDWSHDYCRNH